MKLFSVILVDDEEEVRQAIINKLDWKELGFQVVGSADNGEDALEITERLRPDVVMTDIKMPFMDGLTLARRLKQISKDIKIIVFSGFDEFEYAKEAIKLEVEEYILKPIDAEELRIVFERIREKLNEEINRKLDIEQLRKYYLESLPVMKDQFLIGLLKGQLSKSRVEELVGSYEMDLNYPYFMTAVVHTEYSRAGAADGDAAAPPAGFITLSLKQIVDENLAACCDYISFIYLESVMVIALLKDLKQSNDFIHAMDQICKSAYRILENNTSAGVGFLCDDIMELSRSYAGAENAIDYRILFESNQAIYIQDVEAQEGGKVVWESRYTESILHEIKLGEDEDVIKAIRNMTDNFKNTAVSFPLYQILLMEMVTEIYKLGQAYQIDMDKVFGPDFNFNKKIYQFDSQESLKLWITDICLKVRSSIRRERTDTAKLLIDKAIEFIGENYGDYELSVDTLCSYLNVSATYFSTLFKRETGMSFVNYLTKIRLEKALQLLNTTDEKTYNIATLVGYMEPNYFSYVFKKKYGISPSNYRKNLTAGN